MSIVQEEVFYTKTGSSQPGFLSFPIRQEGGCLKPMVSFHVESGKSLSAGYKKLYEWYRCEKVEHCAHGCSASIYRYWIQYVAPSVIQEGPKTRTRRCCENETGYRSSKRVVVSRGGQCCWSNHIKIVNKSFLQSWIRTHNICVLLASPVDELFHHLEDRCKERHVTSNTRWSRGVE